MMLVIRQKAGRRWRLAADYPLTDNQGISVIQDRRRLPDRRKAEHGIDDLKIMLSKVNSLTIVSLVIAINMAFVLMAYALIVTIQN
jgi:hypothetical protein